MLLRRLYARSGAWPRRRPRCPPRVGLGQVLVKRQTDDIVRSSGDPAYIGYFGLGEVHDVVRTDESVRGTLTLDLLGGHPAEVLEDNPPRPFEINDDTLVVGDQKTWRRTCRRIT